MAVKTPTKTAVTATAIPTIVPVLILRCNEPIGLEVPVADLYALSIINPKGCSMTLTHAMGPSELEVIPG